MKRTATSLTLLALTAFAFPACSFHMSAGSGSKAPSSGSRSNKGATKGPSNTSKALPKSNGGESGEGRPDVPAPNTQADPVADANEGGSGSGETPPKAGTKPGTTSATMVPATDDGTDDGGAGGNGPGSKGHPTGSTDSKGATLSAKPKKTTKPSGRVKSPKK